MAHAHASVTREPIDGAALLASSVSPGDGAALLFWGVVREQNDGRAVSQLEYSAYGPMAEREMLRIADEARARFGTGAIHVVHRVGRLEIGEASVAIAVASPHRAEAYEASRYVIEELKRRVPVGKREGYVDGDSEWVPGFTAVGETEEAPL
jgi:molybdopterin synthase catalytic subunit